jgi:DNA repair protein RadC
MDALSSRPRPAVPPCRPRPRVSEAAERLLLAGTDALSTPELLEVLLEGPRGGAGAAVRALLDGLGGPRGLARAAPGELARVRGVGPGRARRLLAALALGRRLADAPLQRGQELKSTRQVYEAYAAELRAETRERFLIVLLDARHRVLKEEQVSLGTLTSSLVHPREVFVTAIRERAAGVVLLHNHPSGDPEPSPDDEAVTRRLVAAGELLGIPVLDHLVFGAGGYVSLLERGLIPTNRALGGPGAGS